MTRHEMRKWLGGKSLRDFATQAELARHFTSAGLVPIFGTKYSFSEADEAYRVALRAWRDLQRQSEQVGRNA